MSAGAPSALVTGGTSGIGKGIALCLAGTGASVTILGRNKEEGQKVVQQMTQISTDSGSQASHEFIAVDLSLLSTIKLFCETFTAKHARLDYLVLCAGIATTAGYSPTADGIDFKLFMHYFGRVAMIRGLLPLLSTTAEAADTDVRVLAILSAGVHSPYVEYQADFDLSKDFSIPKAANAAGFYTDLALDTLSRENQKISFLHAAPGFVNTNWGTEFPCCLKGLIRCVQCCCGCCLTSLEDCGVFMSKGLHEERYSCLLYTSPSPRDRTRSRMPSSA
eukprot:TRINITY_DN2594_c0_g1_i3.p1 TRINITY_DN2594_c0_g1~~TRINITY_DN2594_c0_g1_i3.p1  ORF type:complete len:277 (+),score=55.32 TRINITY_DN2594_c0_g1_i3:128-958(+)